MLELLTRRWSEFLKCILEIVNILLLQRINTILLFIMKNACTYIDLFMSRQHTLEFKYADFNKISFTRRMEKNLYDTTYKNAIFISK